MAVEIVITIVFNFPASRGADNFLHFLTFVLLAKQTFCIQSIENRLAEQ